MYVTEEACRFQYECGTTPRKTATRCRSSVARGGINLATGLVAVTRWLFISAEPIRGEVMKWLRVQRSATDRLFKGPRRDLIVPAQVMREQEDTAGGILRMKCGESVGCALVHGLQRVQTPVKREENRKYREIDPNISKFYRCGNKYIRAPQYIQSYALIRCTIREAVWPLNSRATEQVDPPKKPTFREILDRYRIVKTSETGAPTTARPVHREPRINERSDDKGPRCFSPEPAGRRRIQIEFATTL
ncbi:hypothetical protein F2P81_005443 [Scophthalmus maximus]|uniref:Uncharacterized protein n=1 Tax=Scophthalmus maximus TaxID=52904 RepID=A0A6A4TGB9_SCOMX|nr:hypothetical protein F2P81_005443 [Scophthalmus maximus]